MFLSYILFWCKHILLHPAVLLIYHYGWPNQTVRYISPFLFIRGLSCPRSVQTSLTQNGLKGANAKKTKWRISGRSNQNIFKFVCAVLMSPTHIGLDYVKNLAKNISCLDCLATSFLFLVVTLALQQNPRSSIGLEIRPKNALTAIGPSCPLQTILLSDLVGCDSLLQIVMAVWRSFF